MRARFVTVVVVTAVVGLLSPAGPAAAGGCVYRLDTRLSAPAGFTNPVVIAGDGAAGYVGFVQARDSDAIWPVVWRNGHVRLLPVPAGVRALAFGVNRLGDAVGMLIDGPGIYRAVLWPGGADPIPLAPLTPGRSAAARDINEAGQIIGDAEKPDGLSQIVTWSMTDPGTVTTVPVSPEQPQTFAGTISSEGVVLGGGFVGSVAGLHLVPSPQGVAPTAAAVAASGRFLAGSYAEVDGSLTVHALVWENEVPTVLSTADSYATGVTATGIVSGVDVARQRAVVWRGAVMHTLPLPPAGTDRLQSDTVAIAEDGTVAGSVFFPRTGRGLLVLWHCR
ncbi:MAG TPA: hypothetical protein VMU51_37375 [Mycobacteriales bacterium]|nr:hypothetical protein [Mycobacteriales bacterium]